jgi:hypothetical protein
MSIPDDSVSDQIKDNRRLQVLARWTKLKPFMLIYAPFLAAILVHLNSIPKPGYP